MSVQELEEIPALGRLYLAAVGNAARSRLSAPSTLEELPAARHSVPQARVDLAKLTDFQRLVAHSAQDTLPSGYVHSFAFPVAMSVMAREDFPLPLLGMVHLRNEVRHLRPIHYTEPLSVIAWAENLSGHRSGTQVELVAEVRSGTELVWTGRSTYLAKGVFLPRFDRPVNRPERTEFVPPLPTAQWRLGADAGRNYAMVSGDFNPIHLSSLSAKALGMKRSIAHGMYLASRVVEEAGPAVQEPFEWEIEFESPVFLPATVSLRISDAGAPGERGETTFTGWNQRTRRRHFHGSARPLFLAD
nr:MaoC/PaaZ C-terminal domain-containing protein [Arthrobacter sp.]